MLWPIGTQVAKLAAMRPSPIRFSLACLAVISSFAMIRCGGGGESSDSLPETAAGTIRDIGNMNFSCGGHGGDGSSHSGQNKKVQFQQQSGGGCDQKVQFEEQKVSDLDVNLDCDQKVVSVKNQGADQKQETLPISQDGSIHGQLHFQSKIKGPQQSGQNDGQNCWVEYVVSFNGKTNCDPDHDSNQNANMKLSTQVAFQQTTVARLAEAGIPGATPTPARETRSGMSEASHSGEHRSPITSGPDTSNPDPVATWTPEPGISGSPSSPPTGSPTARPSYSPTSSPTASPSITPSPSPSLIPVVVCAVQNPCTVTSSDEDFSCGE